jgi:hypothetical protein
MEQVMSIKKVLLAAFLCSAAIGSSWAGGGHYHGGHHHGHGGRVGVYIGVPFGYSWYGPSPYYYPPYYSVPYYAPPVVIRQAPQVYIERAAPQAAPQNEVYWYYCANPAGYYPYVQQCPGGWQRVVPTPPPN